MGLGAPRSVLVVVGIRLLGHQGAASHVVHKGSWLLDGNPGGSAFGSQYGEDVDSKGSMYPRCIARLCIVEESSLVCLCGAA